MTYGEQSKYYPMYQTIHKDNQSIDNEQQVDHGYQIDNEYMLKEIDRS